MDDSLRAVVQDIPLGKILIQTNDETKEPEVLTAFCLQSLTRPAVVLYQAAIEHQGFSCSPSGCDCGDRGSCDDGDPRPPGKKSTQWLFLISLVGSWCS